MRNYILVFLLIFCSCSNLNNRTESKLLGLWQLNSFKKDNLNYTDSLFINTLIFKKGKLGLYVVLPKTENHESEDAYVRLNESKELLSIESVNPNFRGVYKIIFFKNEYNKLLGVKLKSDKNELIAYKAQQDFVFDGINW
jgi:hypothetical protein